MSGLTVEPETQLSGRTVAADLQMEGVRHRQHIQRDALGREQVAESPGRERQIGEMVDGVGGSQLPALGGTGGVEVGEVRRNGVALFRSLLMTMSVNAPSPRAHRAECRQLVRIRHRGQYAGVAESGFVAIVIAIHFHRQVGGRAAMPGSSSASPDPDLRGRKCREYRPGPWRR